MIWLGATELSKLAAISDRKSRRALSLAHQGRPWRGHKLTVRLVIGRGGSGGRQYEVLLSDLPVDLRERYLGELGEAREDVASQLPVLATPAKGTPLPRMVGAFEWRWNIILPAIAAREAGEPVAAILAELAGRKHPTPNGDECISVSQLRRWLDSYTALGLPGLKRRGRADKGVRRVFISRTWDALTASLPDVVREEIQAKIERRIRSLWAGGAQGRRSVAEYATKELVKLTLAAGIELPGAPQARFKLCAVPPALARKARQFGKLHIARTDAKGFKDKFVYHIQRDAPDWPMECVVSDVSPSDIPWERPDGSEVVPRLIVHYDWGTTRARGDVVFPEKGRGVCREHAAASFTGMCLDPDWGVPLANYLDNGSEFQEWTEYAGDVMALARFGGPSIGLRTRYHASGEATTIMRARAYAAASKAVEGFLSVLQRCFLAVLPHYIGGNRLKTRSANEGKKPPAFKGTKGEYIANIQKALAAYNAMPHASGRYKGLSPNQIFERKKAAGWRRTDIEEGILYAAFATEIRRMVRAETIVIENEKYTDTKLGDYAGQSVTVRVPLIGSKEQVAVIADDGTLIGHARRDTWHRYNDPAGAQEKGRRSKLTRERLREMNAETDKIVMTDEMFEYAAMLADGTPTESAGTVEAGETLKAIMRDKAKLPPSGEPPKLYEGEPPQYRALRLAREAREKRSA